MKKLFLLTLLLATTFTASIAKESQSNANTYAVSGKVVDKSGKEAIVGACVQVGEKKVYTDWDGCFTLTNLPDKECQVSVNMISYQGKTLVVNPKKNSKLEITLQQ